MSTDEVERIKRARTEDEAARCSLCERIKDWLVGTDSSQAKIRLFQLSQANHLPEERIEAFFALKAMVAEDYQQNFELCCTRSDAFDERSPVSVELVIKGIYQGGCTFTWRDLSFVDIPKNSNVKVKFSNFLGEHPCESRIVAAGLLNPPPSPPDIVFPESGKVALTWKTPGSLLQFSECVQAKSSTRHAGFSHDFVKDCYRGSYDFYNYQTQQRGCFRYGKKLGSGREIGADTEEASVEEMLLQIKEIYPDQALCTALSHLCHQGYLAPPMQYIHNYCITKGHYGEPPPLMLRQDPDCPPIYVIALREDDTVSIDATCCFGFCDNLHPLDLEGSTLTVRCVSTIKLQSLLAGNLGDSASEYHLNLEDNTEGQFHFIARS